MIAPSSQHYRGGFFVNALKYIGIPEIYAFPDTRICSLTRLTPSILNDKHLSKHKFPKIVPFESRGPSTSLNYGIFLALDDGT